MPVLNQPSVRGDLYATIKVRLPSGLSAQERELFQQLKALRPARRR
jgi:DnaJ-class molecular chaperone